MRESGGDKHHSRRRNNGTDTEKIMAQNRRRSRQREPTRGGEKKEQEKIAQEGETQEKKTHEVNTLVGLVLDDAARDRASEQREQSFTKRIFCEAPPDRNQKGIWRYSRRAPPKRHRYGGRGTLFRLANLHISMAQEGLCRNKRNRSRTIWGAGRTCRGSALICSRKRNGVQCLEIHGRDTRDAREYMEHAIIKQCEDDQ